MATKRLDYGAHEAAEIYDTTRDYSNGDSRLAARSEWFIQFWGYIFKEVSEASVMTPVTDGHLFFIDSTDGTLKIKDDTGTVKKFLAEQVLDGNGIDVVDEGDGTISIDLNALLEDLNDVTITTEQPDDILMRNAANTAWINVDYVENINLASGDSPYSLAPSSLNVHVFCDCSTGAITVNLPPAANYRREMIYIIKNDAPGNDVTIAADGTETINGAASISLTQKWDEAIIFTDGIEWYAKL